MFETEAAACLHVSSVCDWLIVQFLLLVNFRHRPALGECLAHLAAAMPVAYLEPYLNEYNAFSVYTTKTPRERASECLGLSINTSLQYALHNTPEQYAGSEKDNVVLKAL